MGLLYRLYRQGKFSNSAGCCIFVWTFPVKLDLPVPEECSHYCFFWLCLSACCGYQDSCYLILYISQRLFRLTLFSRQIKKRSGKSVCDAHTHSHTRFRPCVTPGRVPPPPPPRVSSSSARRSSALALIFRRPTRHLYITLVGLSSFRKDSSKFTFANQEALKTQRWRFLNFWPLAAASSRKTVSSAVKWQVANFTYASSRRPGLWWRRSWHG